MWTNLFGKVKKQIKLTVTDSEFFAVTVFQHTNHVYLQLEI